MVHGAGVIPIGSDEPLFHGVLHLGAVFVGVGALSADDLEEMVLSITNIVSYAATLLGVLEIFVDLYEPVCCELKGFLDANNMQVNALWWCLFFNCLTIDLLSHVELVGLRVFWISPGYPYRNLFARSFSVLFHQSEQCLPVCFAENFRFFSPF